MSRQYFFLTYWKLGDILSQSTYKCRTSKKAFHFTMQDKSVKACKIFFMRTLDISDRIIRTIKDKIDRNNMIEIVNDLRVYSLNH